MTINKNRINDRQTSLNVNCLVEANTNNKTGTTEKIAAKNILRFTEYVLLEKIDFLISQ